MSVWQIGAGDGRHGRDYTELFVRCGIAAVGPGDPGPFDQHRAEYEDYDQFGFLRAFHDDIAEDDLIVLKRPSGQQWQIIAVGRVSGPYTWDVRLGDVEGWDLQHSLPVAWRVPKQDVVIGGLTRGTLRRVNKPAARRAIQELWERLEGQERPAASLPEPAHELKDEVLIDRLMRRGVATGQAETIQQAIWRIRRLAGWYLRHGGSVGEHEVRTFLIVPLLMALGWPEQRIKIEHEYVDLALWDRPFSDRDAQITVVVESKRLWDALGGTSVAQAQRYAARYPKCQALIVADGYRYKLLTRETSKSVRWKPAAYANLRKLQDRHPTDDQVAGADELFLALLP